MNCQEATDPAPLPEESSTDEIYLGHHYGLRNGPSLISVLQAFDG